ncbi:sugar transferase [Pediococcus pentosaceus]|uniref:sugar transferase n=1 Tax=Pediococcus pentosaceus TaxID=1255 RepID=UPI000CFF1708|nr:sugar transferase [Pediococcus pentosaceus]AVL02766.1 multidrug MFS transporter [Pediococcus pentosaceus]MBF7134790.1 sugar transferase [Pediococcus pentosaceus]QPT36889.1 sugar transferase [Pediococcus pentosaceus]
MPQSKINNSYYLGVKRVMDIILAGLAMIVLSPVFLVVWIMNQTDKSDRGPLFYKQIRMGYHGEKFGMYKFRSMVVNADEKLHADKELYAKYVANNYKLEPADDPRITKVGTFLRKTSIDEIPQFINILRGDMSLVGPRPVVEAELVEYDAEKLLSVKPGAMGLWQASGRSEIGYPERAEIEMEYIDNASIGFDLKIMFMNLVNIFRGKGAY